MISGLVSIVNVTMPSTSAGESPASSSASPTASTASFSSLRPESLENSVAPIPTIAARPPRLSFARTLMPASPTPRDGPAHSCGALGSRNSGA